MFGNYGNLPFSLFETITRDIQPFSSDPMALQRAMAYGSIFLSSASLWLWTFAPWYIKISKEPDINDVSNKIETEESTNEAVTAEQNPPILLADDSKELEFELKETEYSVELDTISSNSTGVPNGTGMAKSCRVRTKECFSRSFEKIRNSPIWNFLTPSSLGCILAVALLAATPVHQIFFLPVISEPTNPATPAIAPSYNGTINTEYLSTNNSTSKPPLQFVADAIGNLANVTVPVSLLILGSNIYMTVRDQMKRSRMNLLSSSTQSVLPLPVPVLAGAVFTRLVILPIIFFFMTWCLFKMGLFPTDPLITLTLGIYGCMPSAINLVILAQLQGDTLVVEQMATILLVQYVLCTFSIFTTIAISIQSFVVS